MSAFFDYMTVLLLSITSFIGACSALAAAIPKPVSDGITAKFHLWLNKCACNIGHAENKQ